MNKETQNELSRLERLKGRQVLITTGRVTFAGTLVGVRANNESYGRVEGQVQTTPNTPPLWFTAANIKV